MIKRNTAAEKRTYFFLFFVLFGLIFARYCYYGFRYFPQLDDYIQYHNYAAYGGGFGTLVKRLGLLSSRPLAGLLDYFVWTRFYGCMIAAVAVISAMYASSAVFFHRVFSKHFGTGQLFFIIYALLPLGFEGTYWLSASSRIVAGLFFTSLSFLFFDNWCGKGARRALVPFIVFQLAAFCLYEQLVLLSGALTLLVMLLHLKQPGIKRAAWGSFMFVNAAVYLAATKLAPAGVYGERTAFFLPWQAGYLESGFLPAGWQIVQVFSEGVLSTSGRGLIRGIKLLAAEPNALWVLAVLLLCFALYFFTVRTKRTGMRFFAELIAGLFLALAPLSLFFVLEGPWFSLRNTVTSFCGLALVCDALFDLVFGRLRIGRAAEAV
ncbi:MAG: hypothetical protein LBL15_02885, partial [Oscillospiraceae bacterium]|nr:hypothetical protein [Oscillospiraceae bacterium]